MVAFGRSVLVVFASITKRTVMGALFGESTGIWAVWIGCEAKQSKNLFATYTKTALNGMKETMVKREGKYKRFGKHL